MILPLVVLAIGFSLYKGWKHEREYQEDVALLYHVGQELGWSPQTHLKFSRAYSHGIGLGPSYDIIRLLFFTPESKEEFKIRVSNAAYGQSKGPIMNGLDYSFLYQTSNTSKAQLVLRTRQFFDANNRTRHDVLRQHPETTRWDFFDGNGKQVIVTYADGNVQQNVWLYDQKSIQGNIVELQMPRH